MRIVGRYVYREPAPRLPPLPELERLRKARIGQIGESVGFPGVSEGSLAIDLPQRHWHEELEEYANLFVHNRHSWQSPADKWEQRLHALHIR